MLFLAGNVALVDKWNGEINYYKNLKPVATMGGNHHPVVVVIEILPRSLMDAVEYWHFKQYGELHEVW